MGAVLNVSAARAALGIELNATQVLDLFQGKCQEVLAKAPCASARGVLQFSWSACELTYAFGSTFASTWLWGLDASYQYFGVYGYTLHLGLSALTAYVVYDRIFGNVVNHIHRIPISAEALNQNLQEKYGHPN